MKIARERKSSVLASNAIHHRIDCLTSIVALLTIGGAHVFTDASWLDPVGSLIISAMVIKGGWGNTMTSLFELADASVDDDIKRSVRAAASKVLLADKGNNTGGVRGGEEVEIRDIQGVKSGQNYLMEVELAVPGSWSVDRIQEIEDAVRERIGSKVRGVRRVKIRFTPKEDKESDFFDEFIGADISPRSSPEPEENHDHDHDHGRGLDHNHNANGQANGIRKRH